MVTTYIKVQKMANENRVDVSDQLISLENKYISKSDIRGVMLKVCAEDTSVYNVRNDNGAGRPSSSSNSISRPLPLRSLLGSYQGAPLRQNAPLDSL
nr:hypothetical protein [Tanacetum cinerariifolium]